MPLVDSAAALVGMVLDMLCKLGEASHSPTPDTSKVRTVESPLPLNTSNPLSWSYNGISWAEDESKYSCDKGVGWPIE